jgi:hypothetical protein
VLSRCGFFRRPDWGSILITRKSQSKGLTPGEIIFAAPAGFEKLAL